MPPDGFTQPKIPSANPIETVDEDRRKLYGPLAQMSEGEAKPDSPGKKRIEDRNLAENIPFPGKPKEADEIPARAPESKPAESLPRDAPSDDDRKHFMRQTLAGKQYDRRYRVFGGSMLFLFVDRSTGETELMYDVLENENLDTEEEWATCLERYQLALQLRKVEVKGDKPPYEAKPMDASQTESALAEDLKDRVKKIMELSKPVYHALMEANRRFEEHVRYLTEHALESDFWKPGGDG